MRLPVNGYQSVSPSTAAMWSQVRTDGPMSGVGHGIRDWLGSIERAGRPSSWARRNEASKSGQLATRRAARQACRPRSTPAEHIAINGRRRPCTSGPVTNRCQRAMDWTNGRVTAWTGCRITDQWAAAAAAVDIVCDHTSVRLSVRLSARRWGISSTHVTETLLLLASPPVTGTTVSLDILAYVRLLKLSSQSRFPRLRHYTHEPNAHKRANLLHGFALRFQPIDAVHFDRCVQEFIVIAALLTIW